MEEAIFEFLGWAAVAVGALIAGVILISLIDWESIVSESKKIMKKKNIKSASAKINTIYRKGDYNMVDVGLSGGGETVGFTVKSKAIDGTLYVGQTRMIMA